MTTYTMKILNTICFCFALSFAFAQNPENPKVGLILSGGGAKGMSHVGVLKEIERAGVRIDYIGGTSMGAIVGALYACGYSASQLEQLLLGIDLNDIVSDNFDRTSKSFDTKEDDERYAITLPIVKGKIQFPISLSKGQNAYNLLVKLMHDQRNTQDFSKLPIPFYCVATDINTGETVLLEEGFLPLAVNASSALPTIFSPVKVKDKILIDGGVADNYPIDIMLQKGVDVIIGVDTQLDIASSVNPKTFSEILMRIGTFQTGKTMAPKIAQTDIYIHPEIHDYSILSFAEQAAIIKKGEEAGKAVFSQLKKLALKQTPHVRYPKKIPDSFHLDELTVSITPNYKRNYLMGKIRLTPNNHYSFKKLQDGLTNLAATNNFDSFRYSLVTKNNKEELQIDLQESPYTTLFRGGLNYNKLTGASALVNLTQKHSLLRNDEVSLDFIFGEYFRYAFSYFIDKGRFWSVGFSATLDQFETEISIPLKSIEYNVSILHSFVQKNKFFLQTLFREEMVLGAGLSHQKNKLKTNLYDDQTRQFLYVDDADYYSTYGFLKIDSRDNAFYPKKGGFFDGSMEYFFSRKTPNQDLGAFAPFVVAKAKTGAAFSLNNKWSVSLNTMAGFSVGESSASTFEFTFGGYGYPPILNFQPFVGLPQHHDDADSFIKGEIVLDYEFLPRHHARVLFHTGILNDDIFSTGEWLKQPDYFGTGLAYGLETFAGPIEFTTAYSPQYGKLIYHVNFGWRF